jgi:hypothetical protein
VVPASRSPCLAGLFFAFRPEIVTDLDSLSETEIELDCKRFVVRSAPRLAASLALRATGVAMPPTVREVAAG